MSLLSIHSDAPGLQRAASPPRSSYNNQRLNGGSSTQRATAVAPQLYSGVSAQSQDSSDSNEQDPGAVPELAGTDDVETVNSRKLMRMRSVRWQRQRVIGARCWHALFVFVCLVFYTGALYTLDSHRRLTSASWREILGELHPDVPKTAERLVEGEVVPKWSENMHIDDVTKNLNWFQTFCWMKHGMDDKMAFLWNCDMLYAKVEMQDGTEPMVDGMNCSRPFVQAHIEHGDDPRCVPWGEESVPMLQKVHDINGGGLANLTTIDPQFDEYTVSGGYRPNPLTKDLETQLDAIKTSLAAIETHLGAASQQRQGANRRWLPGAAADKRPPSPPPSKSAPGAAAACPALEEGCSLFPRAPGELELPCRCFTPPEVKGARSTARSTCTNHHWGLIHLCSPRSLKVGFGITQHGCHRAPGQPRKECAPRMWFLVSMTFDHEVRNDNGPSGWYRAYLDLEDVEFYGQKSPWEGWVGIITVALLIGFILLGPLWFFLCCPCNFRLVWSLRCPNQVRRGWQDLADSTSDGEGTFSDGRSSNDSASELQLVASSWPSRIGGLPLDGGRSGRKAGDSPGHCEHCSQPGSLPDLFEWRLTMLINGRGTRWHYMTLTEMMLENIAAVLLLVGAIHSVRLSTLQRFKGPEDLQPISSMQYAWENLSGWQLFYEVLYEITFRDTGYHCAAWVTMYLTLTFVIFESLEGLRWLPAIMRICAIRILYFLCGYTLLVGGFGLSFWLHYGGRFLQFGTPQRAFYEMVMLSAGMPMYAFQDMYPWEDGDSLGASVCLTLYMIFMAVIMLNFFTTIILDAYKMAKDPRKAEDYVDRSRKAWMEMVMHGIGIRAAEGADKRSQEHELDPLVAEQTPPGGERSAGSPDPPDTAACPETGKFTPYRRRYPAMSL